MSIIKRSTYKKLVILVMTTILFFSLDLLPKVDAAEIPVL